MSEAPELKPCPFCGGEAVLGGTTWRATDGKDIAWIECTACGTFGPTKEPRAAIEAWNTRATAKVEAAVKRAIEACAEKTALIPMRIPNDPFFAYHAALEATDGHIRALAQDPEAIAKIVRGE